MVVLGAKGGRSPDGIERRGWAERTIPGHHHRIVDCRRAECEILWVFTFFVLTAKESCLMFPAAVVGPGGAPRMGVTRGGYGNSVVGGGTMGNLEKAGVLVVV